MSLIADMNSLRTLPTVERERNALLANIAFAAVVVGALWVFEVPVVVPSVLIAIMLGLQVGRLARRARLGDEPGAA